MTRKQNTNANDNPMSPVSPKPPTGQRHSSQRSVSQKTNLAFRRKYQQSRQRRNWMPYGIAIGALIALVSVLQYARTKTPKMPNEVRDSERTASNAVVAPEQNHSPKSTSHGGPAVDNVAGAIDPHETASDVAEKKTARVRDLPAQSKPDSTQTARTKPAGGMSDSQRRQYGSSLRSAWENIADRQFSQAAKQIESTTKLPLNDLELAKAERLRLLCDYVEEFWKAFDESLVDLDGVELTVNGEQTMVVSANETRLVLRQLGENRDYDTFDLPPDIVLTIASRRFDPTAASSDVFKGAYMAVTPEFGKVRARNLWRQAVAAGVDIGDLATVLDDEY